MAIEIRRLYVDGVLNLKGTTVFFHKNTIIMGSNNSGKTRILNIIKAIFDRNFTKIQKYTKSDAKIKLEFMYLNKVYKLLFSGINLESAKENDLFYNNFSIDVCFIPSNNLDLNTWITNLMQNEISKTKEFHDFKKRVEDLTDQYLANINKGIFSDKTKNNIKSKPEDKLPTFKIQLLRNGIDINEEGDGFKKHIMIQLLIQNLLKSENSLILIDEIENHFSVKTIQFVLNNIPTNSQIIATSHRIEINNSKLNSLTTLNNKIMQEFSAHFSDDLVSKIILVESKSDFFIIAKVIEMLKLKSQWIIIVTTKKEYAEKLSLNYGCIAFMNRYNSKIKNSNYIYFTNKKHILNYVPQSFFDNNPKLQEIKISTDISIQEMIKNAALFKFKRESNFKDYFASKVTQWLQEDNDLVKEIKNILISNKNLAKKIKIEQDHNKQTILLLNSPKEKIKFNTNIKCLKNDQCAWASAKFTKRIVNKVFQVLSEVKILMRNKKYPSASFSMIGGAKMNMVYMKNKNKSEYEIDIQFIYNNSKNPINKYSNKFTKDFILFLKEVFKKEGSEESKWELEDKDEIIMFKYILDEKHKSTINIYFIDLINEKILILNKNNNPNVWRRIEKLRKSYENANFISKNKLKNKYINLKCIEKNTTKNNYNYTTNIDLFVNAVQDIEN